MSNQDNLVHQLRSVSIRRLESALRRDGFILLRQTGSSRIYVHDDGRITNIHFHSSSATLKRKTLATILSAVGWTVEDARRLGLL